MDAASITNYITSALDGLDVIATAAATFFFYDPGRKLRPDRRMPFATIVISDAFDSFSNLSRPSVFRLNIEISKETFLSMFGSKLSTDIETTGRFDFTALDQVMPHPVYGRMYWACVLNPSAATFERVKALLGEAYEIAVARQQKTIAEE